MLSKIENATHLPYTFSRRFWLNIAFTIPLNHTFFRESLENGLAIRKPSKTVIYFTFIVPEICILSKTLSLLSKNSVFNTSASVFCYCFSLEIILKPLVNNYIFITCFLLTETHTINRVTVTRKLSMH